MTAGTTEHCVDVQCNCSFSYMPHIILLVCSASVPSQRWLILLMGLGAQRQLQQRADVRYDYLAILSDWLGVLSFPRWLVGHRWRC